MILITNSGADSMRHGGARAPTFTNDEHGGGTVSRRTTNKKLAKLYWSSRKRSPKRLIVLLKPKSGGAQPKIFFWRFAPNRCPPLSLRTGAYPTFKFVPAATGATNNQSVYSISQFEKFTYFLFFNGWSAYITLSLNKLFYEIGNPACGAHQYDHNNTQ